PCSSRARRRVFHPGRVEGRSPPALVVLGQLQVVALAVHAHGDVADTGPGVEPGVECPESPVIRGTRKPGEAEGCLPELAALVEHGATRLLPSPAAAPTAGS